MFDSLYSYLVFLIFFTMGMVMLLIILLLLSFGVIESIKGLFI